jgi:hypothetical protein
MLTPHGLGFTLTPDGMTVISPGLHGASAQIDLSDWTTRSLAQSGIATVSPDGRYAALDGGMVDLSDGQTLYAFPDGAPGVLSYSSDSTLYAAPDGIYLTQSGAQVFDAPQKASVGPFLPQDETSAHQRAYAALVGQSGAFSPDGTRLSVALVNSALPSGSACLIFAATGGTRFGAIYASARVNVRATPFKNGGVAYSMPARGSHRIVGLAINDDGKWYQLEDMNWISAEVAVPLYLPARFGGP